MSVSGTLGERITALRTTCRMSQKDLADFLYVNQATVSRWERNIRFPDDDVLIKMAARFKVDPSELLVPSRADLPPSVVVFGPEETVRELIPDLLVPLLPDALVSGCTSSSRLMAFAAEKYIDILFLDADHYKEEGASFLSRLGDMFPRLNLIFVSSSSRFMKAAFRLHASGYLLTPLDTEAVSEELKHLRFPVNGV